MIPYYIVDVFANEKYQGNQLAVYIDIDNELSKDEMQAIASEMQFSEVSFIKDVDENNTYTVRIFKQDKELPFAGHPCLGTAFVISQFLNKRITDKLCLKLNIGLIEIQFLSEQKIFMRQQQPKFIKSFTHEEIATDLGIYLSDLNSQWKIECISTGLPYIIIPLKNLNAIENTTIKPKDAIEFLKKHQLHSTNNTENIEASFFFVCPDTYEDQNDFNTRMFHFVDKKLQEDPATGSAQGCFLAYLLKHQQSTVNLIIEQGFQMKRQSYIYLKGLEEENEYFINVGGKVQLIAEGNWY